MDELPDDVYLGRPLEEVGPPQAARQHGERLLHNPRMVTQMHFPMYFSRGTFPAILYEGHLGGTWYVLTQLVLKFCIRKFIFHKFIFHKGRLLF